jgi:hypothetical protein
LGGIYSAHPRGRSATAVGLALQKIILLTTEAFSIKTQVLKLLILRVGAQEFESRATIALLDV